MITEYAFLATLFASIFSLLVITTEVVGRKEIELLEPHAE
jgi:hypothetical protein